MIITDNRNGSSLCLNSYFKATDNNLLRFLASSKMQNESNSRKKEISTPPRFGPALEFRNLIALNNANVVGLVVVLLVALLFFFLLCKYLVMRLRLEDLLQGNRETPASTAFRKAFAVVLKQLLPDPEIA